MAFKAKKIWVVSGLVVSLALFIGLVSNNAVVHLIHCSKKQQAKIFNNSTRYEMEGNPCYEGSKIEQATYIEVQETPVYETI